MKIILKKGIFLGIISFFLLYCTTPVFAAGELQIRSESGKPFMFQPKAGEIMNSKVFVTNLSKTQTSNVKLYPKDATTTSDGRFDLLREDQKSNQLGTWIQLSKTALSVQPGKTVEVPFNLKIPKNIEPGQYIGGIVVQGEPIMGKKSKEGVVFNLIPRAGVFVTVNAPGQQVRLLKISGFGGNVNYDGDQAVFNISLLNSGNMSLNTIGYIDIKNSKGRTIKKVDVDLGYLMPRQKVERQININDISHFGAAKAELVVRYAEGKMAKASTHILFIPKKIIIVAVIFVFAGIGVSSLLAKKYDIQIKRKGKVVTQ